MNHTITASAGADGSISPAGAVSRRRTVAARPSPSRRTRATTSPTCWWTGARWAAVAATPSRTCVPRPLDRRQFHHQRRRRASRTLAGPADQATDVALPPTLDVVPTTRTRPSSRSTSTGARPNGPPGPDFTVVRAAGRPELHGAGRQLEERDVQGADAMDREPASRAPDRLRRAARRLRRRRVGPGRVDARRHDIQHPRGPGHHRVCRTASPTASPSATTISTPRIVPTTARRTTISGSAPRASRAGVTTAATSPTTATPGSISSARAAWTSSSSVWRTTARPTRIG